MPAVDAGAAAAADVPGERWYTSGRTRWVMGAAAVLLLVMAVKGRGTMDIHFTRSPRPSSGTRTNNVGSNRHLLAPSQNTGGSSSNGGGGESGNEGEGEGYTTANAGGVGAVPSGDQDETLSNDNRDPATAGAHLTSQTPSTIAHGTIPQTNAPTAATTTKPKTMATTKKEITTSTTSTTTTTTTTTTSSSSSTLSSSSTIATTATPTTITKATAATVPASQRSKCPDVHLPDGLSVDEYCSRILRTSWYSECCHTPGPAKWPVIVTGTPRSGTVFAKKFLSMLGLAVHDDWG